MASKRWVGKAASVKQVVTFTVGVDDVGTTYTVTINSKAVAVLGTGSGTSATAAALQALLAASTEGEFIEVVWSVLSNVVTATSVLAGRPFTATASVAGGAGTLVQATVTPNTSPNDVANPVNWSPSMPVSGDDLYLDSTDVDLSWNLDQFASISPATLTIAATYTGKIGLPERNVSGNEYTEYRPTYWQIGTSLTGAAPAWTYTIGDGPGQGSGRIKLNVGPVQTTGIVHGTDAGADPNLEALIFKGTHASNVCTVTAGSMGVAVFGADVSTLLSWNVLGTGQVRGGAGLTLTNFTLNGGAGLLNNTVTTIKTFDGTLVLMAGNVTTLQISGGTVAYLGTGTITTLNGDNGGTVDFTQDPRGRVVTNATINAGFTTIDTFGTVTWTNPITFNRCAPFIEASITLREHCTLTVTYL